MTDATQTPPRRGPARTQIPPSAPRKPSPLLPNPEEASTRKKGVLELIGAACIPLAGMAAVQQSRNEDDSAISPFAMDIYTIQANAEPIADAVVAFADNYPVLGAILDKVSKASGLGGLVATVMTVGLQIAENHGKLALDARLVPGVMPREDVARAVRMDAEARMKAATNGDTATS